MISVPCQVPVFPEDYDNGHHQEKGSLLPGGDGVGMPASIHMISKANPIAKTHPEHFVLKPFPTRDGYLVPADVVHDKDVYAYNFLA